MTNFDCFTFPFAGGFLFCLVIVLALRLWKAAKKSETDKAVKKSETDQDIWSSPVYAALCDLAATATDFHILVLRPCPVSDENDQNRWKAATRQKIEDFVREYKKFLRAGGDPEFVYDLLPDSDDDLELPECMLFPEDLKKYLLGYVSMIENERRR